MLRVSGKKRRSSLQNIYRVGEVGSLDGGTAGAEA